MKLLVVDDEQKIRDFLKRSFEEECFVVDTAGNGLEGVQFALINEYDLVILDNQMPNYTGLEVCNLLREKGKKFPILILSVNSDTDIKVDMLNAGADDYLTKPFSFQELLARVHALLRRPRDMTDSIIKAYGITLDSRKHNVLKNGVPVSLTRKEFMLLEYLMRNRGNVLSRGLIMEHVWDMNADPFSNTIESHILNLRKKIDIKNREKFIKTIPGRGYKFVEDI